MQQYDSDIVLVSGHWPLTVEFATKNRINLQYYCNIHKYDFYYDEIEPLEKEVYALHYRRCEILKRASLKFPNAKWYLWLDSDVFAYRMNLRIESIIDLSNPNILYHCFHERPWDYRINSGVKFVNRNAIKIESDIWELRKIKKWQEFPYEQKVMCDKIIPENINKIMIHDPYILNCIEALYPIENALFVHMANRPEELRNNMMNKIHKAFMLALWQNTF